MEEIQPYGKNSPLMGEKKPPKFLWISFENYSMKISFFTSASDFHMPMAWESPYLGICAFTFPIWLRLFFLYIHNTYWNHHTWDSQNIYNIESFCFLKCFTFPPTDWIRRAKNMKRNEEYFSHFCWFFLFSMLRTLISCLCPAYSTKDAPNMNSSKQNRDSMRKVPSWKCVYIRTWG